MWQTWKPETHGEYTSEDSRLHLSCHKVNGEGGAGRERERGQRSLRGNTRNALQKMLRERASLSWQNQSEQRRCRREVKVKDTRQGSRVHVKGQTARRCQGTHARQVATYNETLKKNARHWRKGYTAEATLWGDARDTRQTPLLEQKRGMHCTRANVTETLERNVLKTAFNEMPGIHIRRHSLRRCQEFTSYGRSSMRQLKDVRQKTLQLALI